MAKDSVVIMGCGDIGPVHGDMSSYSTLVRPVLAAADIRFGQFERLYSESGGPSKSGKKNNELGNHALKPDQISIFTDSGFDVISLAGNHTMEWGETIVLDTIALFKKKGIQVVGAGRNIQEARQPAIIEKNGVKVAFLAYCSVMRPGDEAGPNKVGIAPMRIRESYEKKEWQPGIPPRVVTVPNEEDVAAMASDIARAKKDAHAVVVSFHWGVHIIPRLIAEYQPVVAKAAFDAGCDLILGHHPHVPKAIELHGGNKVCFYSLGNFMFSTDTGLKPGYAEKMLSYGVDPDMNEYPHCPHGRDSHHSLIAKAEISRAGVEKVSFLPVQIDKQLRPEVLNHGDPRFNVVVNYMDWTSAGRDHKFKVKGDEVVLT